MEKTEREEILSKFSHIFEDEKKFYNNKKDISSRSKFDLESESFFKLANLKFKELLGYVKGKKILDVGCGRGSLSFYLAEKGANVIGIDLSKNFIDICEQVATELKLDIEFKVMNAQIPEFDDNTFDIITGSRVIHHLPDIETFLTASKRLLKKKGYIVFIEPLKKNIIVELNRKYFAPKERTKYEHPLYMSDVMKGMKVFGNITHSEFFLLSPVARVFQKFIRNPNIFIILYKFLNFIEKPLYKINFLKQYCWQTVFKCVRLN